MEQVAEEIKLDFLCEVKWCALIVKKNKKNGVQVRTPYSLFHVVTEYSAQQYWINTVFHESLVLRWLQPAPG
jgi:hypothetical protein